MKEEMKLFLQKMVEDEELMQKMKACKSSKEAYAIASSVQDGLAFEEFKETMTQIYNLSEQEGILSDEDLAKAAGGGSDEERLSWGVTISTSFIGTCLCAAAFA